MGATLAPMTGTGQRQNPMGYHPNSLEASRDPEIHRKIREGRAEFKRDHQLFEQWAHQGFSASTQEDSE